MERVGVAVKRENEPLAQAFGRAVQEMRADGSDGPISKKYIGEDIRCW